jgi:ABC-type transport system substrate-binding protein
MLKSKLSNRYEIASELGRGGMGVVYRARDPILNRDVAVKLIGSSELTSDIEERFQREAQIVAQMDHPGIVPIHDLGRHEGSLFFVMPFVEGTNLRRLLWDSSLRLGEVLDIAIQVADALEYSHSRGVVHRDIKPENIMVVREEGGSPRVRVMDFGLAYASSENRLTKTGTLIGTVGYLSPEQVSSHGFDGRSDIYSLGVVLYECLTGEPPFTGEVQSVLYRIVHEVPQPPRALGAEIREELESIVLQCLEKDPARRPQKAGHVAEALRRHRAGLRTDEFGMSVVVTASRTYQRPSASAFIGREKEFTELQHRLNAAVGGACQFAVVAGEPGIGKTRLLEELKKLATMRKIRVLYGRFVEQDRAFSYQGFCELIQDYFQSKDPGSSSGERPDFSDLAPELLSLFPLLTEIGELRSAVSGDSRVVATGERKAEDRVAVFELLARTLARIAAGKPLVLILENLHAAEVSIEALQYIVRRLGPTPTFFVGSYRHTETDKRHPLVRMLDSFADDPRFVSMTLPPFSPSEHRALVESVVGAPKLSEEVCRRLHEASEGNPFFTKELVHSLIDSGGIAKDDTGAWSFAKRTGISTDALPATIQQAVEKRIERLPAELRDFLSTASVLGRSFEFRDLETLSDGTRNLEDSVDRLLAEGILEEERESRGDRLAFSSGIVRDVLYGALSRRRRRSLHRKYAELLERRYAGRLERIYPELVHHFSQGDVPEKTVEYGLQLARKSLETFSPDDTIRATRTALEFLQDEEWAGDRALEGHARLLLAEAQRMGGNPDAALREAEEAVAVLDREGQAEKALTGIVFAAETSWQGRRTEETRRWAERGIEVARAVGKTEPLRVLLSLAAAVANMKGEYAKAGAYVSEIDQLKPGEKPTEEEVPRGGTLVVAMAAPVADLEPSTYQTTEESEVVANVFETLVTTDSEGSLVPSLCEEWSLKESGRAVRLRLRPGVVFSDGTPLTAAVVKKSLERSIRLARDSSPPAFAPIAGVPDYLEGRSAEVSGITTPSEAEIEIQLVEALPIYPALLTDGRTSIAVETAPEDGAPARALGTGPFRLTLQTPDRAVLERNERYRKTPSRLDRVEFRASLSASAIAEGLRSGSIDLARDLLPADREAILREPRFRSRLVEQPKKNTYFALFNSKSPVGSSAALRVALANSVRARDFVWGALGRFALPATGLLPPGILGHDPGRRQSHFPQEKAAEMIRSSGLEPPIRLRASVHPLFGDQYGALTSALFESWKELGVEVTVGTRTMPEYLASWNENAGIDLLVGRWIADFDDPDDFTFTLFHSDKGLLRGYFSSPDTDRILEDARHESDSDARENLYRRFEDLLRDSGILVPLFHDVDYRIASPAVRGLAVRGTAPWVNYPELGKAAMPAVSPSARRRGGGGIIQVPIAGIVRSLDPAIDSTVEKGETLPNIFETLTRQTEGAVVIPWLVSEITAENEGLRYRFRLRPGIRFHDGRPLTSRDVRHSFERLLLDEESDTRWPLSPIRGARRLLERQATDLEGFHIVSPTEFFIDLVKPVPFFPALMSEPAAAIVPEGTTRVRGTWRDECVGSGPFRVVAFEPGQRLQLERNPHYWREGYPKSDGIVFRFGMSPEEIRSEFLEGRLSIASDLLPSDVETLRRDPRHAAGYRESPRLSTYLVAFNVQRGVFADARLRRGIAQAVDAAALVRRTLGRLAIPANGLIPPGLLGHSFSSSHGARKSGAPGSEKSASYTVSHETRDVIGAIHPMFFGELAGFFQELSTVFREIGFAIRASNDSMHDFIAHQKNADVDLSVMRWVADYPDADTFVNGILQSDEGMLGSMVGSPQIDELIERGRSEVDPDTRHSIYRQIEDLLARDAILIPLFHEQVYHFVRPEVEGHSIGFALPTVAYENLSIRR